MRHDRGIVGIIAEAIVIANVGNMRMKIAIEAMSAKMTIDR
jgi:hypothetical protein